MKQSDRDAAAFTDRTRDLRIADRGVCNATGKCENCNTVADCTQPEGECATVSCDSGTCTPHNKTMGTLVSTQTIGDCQDKVCDGLGSVTQVANNLDLPDDGNECTSDSCTAGMVGHGFLTGPCGQEGAGLMCDGAGHCGGCTDVSQCPQGDFCKTPKCSSGTCDFDFTLAGTASPTQTTGDCTSLQCDGHGQLQPVADPNDKPADDGTVCTIEGCVGTTPGKPAARAGTHCENGGVCDGSGHCNQCNSPADCPDTGTVCKTTTCSVAGVCGTQNADGTVCGAAGCLNGTETSAAICAGGSCPTPTTTMCPPYICGATSCTTSCGSDPGCAPGSTCDTGIGRCGDPSAPHCTDYCAELATNCVGMDDMYFSNQACLATCAAFPLGVVGDTGGDNSLGCRLYHGGGPSAAAPNTHCPHAGPAGESVCGGECESFCTLAAGLCTGAKKQWPDVASCMTDCATFPITPQYNAAISSGDSFACRMYHLTAASLDPVTHCPHIQKVSAVCH